MMIMINIISVLSACSMIWGWS